jgi:hypothetical protein
VSVLPGSHSVEVASRPLQGTAAGVDRRRPRGASHGGDHGESARVREQVQHLEALRRGADAPAVVALVEEDARGEPVAEVHLEGHAPLDHLEGRRGGVAGDRLRWSDVVASRVDDAARVFGPEFRVHPGGACVDERLRDGLRLGLGGVLVKREHRVPPIEIDRDPRQPVSSAVDDAQGVRVARRDDAEAALGRVHDRRGQLLARARAARRLTRQRPRQLRRHGRVRGERLSRRRVAQLERSCVEHEPHLGRTPVQGIAHDRRARRGELHAQLVGSAGLRHELHEGTPTPTLQHHELGDGLLLPASRPAIERAGSARAVLRLRYQVVEHDLGGHPPLHDRDVHLADLVALELLRQRGVGLSPPREQQDAARVAIEPLMDPEVRGAACALEVRREPGHHIVVATLVGRVRGQPIGLVDDQDVLVVDQDPRPGKLGEQRDRRGGRRAHFVMLVPAGGVNVNSLASILSGKL